MNTAGVKKLICVPILSFLLTNCVTFILNQGFPQHDGVIEGFPVDKPVYVYRDPLGIPAIYAENIGDLLVAQGFLHAQDRLWQMETLRRIATGTLSQIAGDEYVINPTIKKTVNPMKIPIKIAPPSASPLDAISRATKKTKTTAARIQKNILFPPLERRFSNDVSTRRHSLTFNPIRLCQGAKWL